MGETVYADILFFINFSMDFLCFYICSRVLGRRLHVLRATVASVIGGAYSVAMLFFDPGGSAEILLDIGVLLIMCAVAQPNGKNSLAGEFGGAAMYAGISAALGGFMPIDSVFPEMPQRRAAAMSAVRCRRGCSRSLRHRGLLRR